MQVEADPVDARVLHGGAIIREIQASRIDFLMSVPDLFTSEGLLRPLTREWTPRMIRVAREDEGVGIAAALSYCGKRALSLIQYTGFLDSINALRAVGVDYKMPICLMVGLLGHEGGVPPRQSPRYGVRIIEPILEAMGVASHVIDHDGDLAKIAPAIDDAYTRSWPVVFLIARKPVSA